MKIAIIGFGKMGKAIERLAQPDHQVVLKIGEKNQQDLTKENLAECDVAIEFSNPAAAFENITFCLAHGVPVISGTTGWLDLLPKVKEICSQFNGTFFYASNFSLGVNLFFALNKKLARIMNGFPQYKIDMDEIHHIHKLDAPSGTAITLAEGIIENHDNYSNWNLDEKSAEQSEGKATASNQNSNQIPIRSPRAGEVPGTHIINYTSSVDKITIHHEAFTRDSFAQGALVAAAWVKDKKGIFGMQDLMRQI